MTQIESPRIARICYVWCGVPGDTATCDRILSLAERVGARVDIVAVLEEPPAGMLKLLTSLGANPRLVLGEDEAQTNLAQLEQLATSRGLSCSSQLLRGAVFPEVMRFVREGRHDLVVKSVQPVNLVHQVFFGHIDRQFVRKCPCPVWIEKGTQRRANERILAAVDVTPLPDDGGGATRDDLNQSILALAVAVRRALDLELHVVHVWPFHLEGALQRRAGLSDLAVAQVGESIRHEHEQALARLLGPYLPEVSRVHLIKGYPGPEIARLVNQEAFDTVVMGTVCRTGVTGLLIGNTAETVLDQVDCSLLALKPAGFTHTP